MGKHTPGPWSVNDTERFGMIVDGPPSEGRICTGLGYGDRGAANARLIAAAPDLLAAAKLVRTRWQRWIEAVPNGSWKSADQNAVEALIAAVEKAEAP